MISCKQKEKAAHLDGLGVTPMLAPIEVFLGLDPRDVNTNLRNYGDFFNSKL